MASLHVHFLQIANQNRGLNRRTNRIVDRKEFTTNFIELGKVGSSDRVARPVSLQSSGSKQD